MDWQDGWLDSEGLKPLWLILMGNGNPLLWFSLIPYRPLQTHLTAWFHRPGNLSCGGFQIQAVTNGGAFKVISTQMGDNTTPSHQIWSLVIDENWTFNRHDFFPPSNQLQMWLSDQLFFKQNLTSLHPCVSLRWRCHGRPVSQRTLPAHGGSPLPHPLNVAPSFVFSSHEEDTNKDLGNLSTNVWFHPITWGVIFQLFPSGVCLWK